jgi:uncharacterized membrane protein YkoI
MSAICQVSFDNMDVNKGDHRNIMRRQFIRTLALLLSLSCLAAGARAGEGEHDQDRVRRAVERGEIKSLTDILGTIRGELPGDVVGVEIEHKHGRWLYELRVADRKGRLFEVYVDARNGAIERIKEK